MSHSFGAGVGTVPYDSHTTNSFVSTITLDVNDTSDSNRLVYVNGTFDVSIDGNQYLSFKFLDSSGNTLNSRYSSKASRTTSRFMTTSSSNLITNGYWNLGTANSSNVLYGEMQDVQIYLDMNRTSNGAGRVSGYWTTYYENTGGVPIGANGSFVLASNTIVTALEFSSNGPGSGTVRGNCRSQVILGRY
jgi:hypothetical protein